MIKLVGESCVRCGFIRHTPSVNVLTFEIIIFCCCLVCSARSKSGTGQGAPRLPGVIICMYMRFEGW